MLAPIRCTVHDLVHSRPLHLVRASLVRGPREDPPRGSDSRNEDHLRIFGTCHHDLCVRRQYYAAVFYENTVGMPAPGSASSPTQHIFVLNASASAPLSYDPVTGWIPPALRRLVFGSSPGQARVGLITLFSANPGPLRSPLPLLAVGAAFLRADTAGPSEARPWGEYGHRIAAEAAAARLPPAMPEFFRVQREQLVYLSPEPDRWREGHLPQMREGFRYDHYIDLERVPPEVRRARDRWSFSQALHSAGIDSPHQQVGFLPFRILELYQRLESGFGRWRSESDPERRTWIERRIINDAGILGHYATDASNPHHATIHFNGWDEASEPNSGGFTTDRDFHARFEARFISSHLQPEDVVRALPDEPEEISDVYRAVWDLIDDSNSQVHRLYELERDVGFDPQSPPHDDALRFAVDRLSVGAQLLGQLWWTAWIRSGRSRPGPPRPDSNRVRGAILLGVDVLNEATVRHAHAALWTGAYGNGVTANLLPRPPRSENTPSDLERGFSYEALGASSCTHYGSGTRTMRPFRIAGLLALDDDGAIDLSRSVALSLNGYWISINRSSWWRGIVPSARESGVPAATRSAIEGVVAESGERVVLGTFTLQSDPDMGPGGPTGGDLYWGTRPGYRSSSAHVDAEAVGPGRLTAGHGFPPDVSISWQPGKREEAKRTIPGDESCVTNWLENAPSTSRTCRTWLRTDPGRAAMLRLDLRGEDTGSEVSPRLAGLGLRVQPDTGGTMTKEKLVAHLNEDLAGELGAIIQYLTYAAKASGPYRLQLVQFFGAEIEDERIHADYLANKIVALGGEPTTVPRPVPPASGNKEMLEAVLAAELQAVADYTRRAQEAEAFGDKGLAVQLEDMVRDETSHAEETARVLHDWIE